MSGKDVIKRKITQDRGRDLEDKTYFSSRIQALRVQYGRRREALICTYFCCFCGVNTPTTDSKLPTIGWEEMHLVGPHKPVRAASAYHCVREMTFLVQKTNKKKKLSKNYHDSGGEICTSRRGTRCLVWVSESEVAQLCPTLYDPMDYIYIAHQAPLAMGFSRQEYWSRLPCPPPRDLPNPRIEPRPPTLRVDTLSSEPPLSTV